MANNDVTVVTGVKESVALAVGALHDNLESINKNSKVFLCDIYKSGANWYHVLIHQT